MTSILMHHCRTSLLTLLLLLVSDAALATTPLSDAGRYAILGGDILLDKQDSQHQKIIAALSPNKAGLVTLGATQIDSVVKKWPNGHIYFTVRGISAAEKRLLWTCMKHLEFVSNVRFIEQAGTGDYKLTVRKNSSINGAGRATLGYLKNPTLEINTLDYGGMLHELMHVLGMIHEHQRSDRDSYVTIQWNNIIDDTDVRRQFDALPNLRSLSTYDYQSLMHYDAYAYSNAAGAVTIDSHGNAIGNRYGLSNGDKQSLAQLYGSPKLWRIKLKNTRKNIEAYAPGDNGSGMSFVETPPGSGINSRQQFRFVHVEGPYFAIINHHYNTAMDVSGVSLENFAAIHQWDYVGGHNQMWKIENSGDTPDGAPYRPLFHITARHSNKVLDGSSVPLPFNGRIIWLDFLTQNAYNASRHAYQNWSIW